MDDGREIELVGQRSACPEKVVRAPVRRRRGDQHADPTGPGMVGFGEVANEGQELVAVRSRQRSQAGQHVGWETLLGKGPAVDNGFVDHGEPEIRPHPRVFVGLQGRIHMASVDARTEAHVVHNGGGSGAQRLDRARHCPQVDLTVGQPERLRRPQVGHHEFHGEVLHSALYVVVPGVEMPIDHAGGGQGAHGIDDVVGAVEDTGRLDGRDAVRLD